MRQGHGALEGSGRNGARLAKKASAAHPAKKAAKHASKKATKQPAKEHAAKAAKHAAKKATKHHAAKKAAPHRPSDPVEASLRQLRHAVTPDELLGTAAYALHRAVALISLLREESGGDLRMLLDRGVACYEEAVSGHGRGSAQQACGLLRAAEHLGMAGLYEARREFAVEVAEAQTSLVVEVRQSLRKRLDALNDEDVEVKRLVRMARELARRAEATEDDAHMEYELLMAAHWICFAFEG